MTIARCPRCQVEVGSTWRWCLACGYDPDGSAERVRQAAIVARQQEKAWLPVAIVLVGLLVGGVVLWRTTPDDTALPTMEASTASEVVTWVPFTPPSGGFTVDLPQRPAASPGGETVPAGRVVESYAVGAAGHLFTVGVVDTGRPELAEGRDPGAVDAALRAFVDELARSTSGTVASVEDDPVGSAPGIRFRIDDGVVGEVHGRVALLGTRLCSISVSSRQAAGDTVARALGSFTPA